MAIVASIQMCSSTVIDENLKQAGELIEQAAQNGAALVVLPEAFLRISGKADVKMDYQEKLGDGKVQNYLARLAERHHVWLVGGTIPILNEKTQRARSACLIFDNKGQPVGRYDKIHLFDVKLSSQESYRESDSFEAGDTTLIIDTPLGKLGVCICYDIRFPALLAELVANGAEVIAIPAAFTKQTGQAHWQLLARCRAIDTFCYIIGACQGGIHSNRRETYGHTMIVNPWGEVLDEVLQPGPGIAYAEIDRHLIYEIRKKIPTLNA